MKVMVSLVLLIGGSNANAYIDPGTGSAIVSAIVGLVVAIGVAVKTYWYKLKSLFGVGKKDAIERDDDPESSEAEKNDRSS